MAKKNIDLQEIIDLYNENLPIVQIAERLNCTISNISRRLKKAGFVIKKHPDKVRYNRTNRYSVNIDYFDIIDTNEKAYFLGLLYSDGSVSKNGFYLKLTDEDVLISLKEQLNYNGPIKFIDNSIKHPKWKNAYLLQIHSKHVSNALQNQGCFINKTRILKFPSIEERFYSHFIRGFFDGDGCIQLNEKLYKCRFDLTSASKDLLEQMRLIISKIAVTNGYLGKEKYYDVWHLNYTGRQIIQILDWLYNDSTVHLKRKYFKYKLLCSR